MKKTINQETCPHDFGTKFESHCEEKEMRDDDDRIYFLPYMRHSEICLLCDEIIEQWTMPASREDCN